MLLEARGLTRRFGGHVAVNNVDLSVRGGTLHAIIGPNGAGKTTLFNLLSGELKPSAGAILFDGCAVTELDITARVRAGIGRTFQRTNIFPGLSVFENLRIAAQARSAKRAALWRRADSLGEVSARAERVLEETSLSEMAHKPARELAGGDQRLLELGVALATAPVMLLLDEPSQGLSPEDARRLIARIRALAARYTVLLIEHNMALVMELSDEITVMNFGAVLARGTPAEIRADARVREAYLGRRG